MTAVGVVVFVLALLASIALHELGHLATAKHFGMKVTQYFIGFGPRLWSVRRGETEYGVKAIPAGGFVKIVGMTPLEELDSTVEHPVPARRDGRPRYAGGPLAGATTVTDAQRAFYRFPGWPRTAVLAAGSGMHFVIAVVLTFASLLVAGDLSRPHLTASVASVTRCLPVSETVSDAQLAACAAGMTRPAPAGALLSTDDTVVAVDGTPVRSAPEVTRAVRNHPGQPVTLTVRRHGVVRAVTVVPVAVQRAAEPGDPGTGAVRTVGAIGIAFRSAAPHRGLLGSLARTPVLLGVQAWDSLKALGAIPSKIPGLLSSKPRDVTGPTGVVGIARVSGQIASSGQSVATRAGEELLLVGGLNLFVGVFNLLPLLPLDGGHIAILGFENARSALARKLRRRDPGRVDLAKVMPVAYTVVLLFVSLTVLLVYADIVNPIKL